MRSADLRHSFPAAFEAADKTPTSGVDPDVHRFLRKLAETWTFVVVRLRIGCTGDFSFRAAPIPTLAKRRLLDAFRRSGGKGTTTISTDNLRRSRPNSLDNKGR